VSLRAAAGDDRKDRVAAMVHIPISQWVHPPTFDVRHQLIVDRMAVSA